MKRIIALILTLTMCIGMIVSASAATPFEKRIGLVRLIKMMFARDGNAPEIGKLDGEKLVVYVAKNGKNDADGTEKNPFATIQAARDAIRTIDKSEYDGITVIVKAGTYSLTDTILFTEEDSGTASCPITYLGEEGVILVGGAALSSSDFTPATGDIVQYFPEADKIVQIDLTKLGYTIEDIAEYLKSNYLYSSHPFLVSNGERQTICQYPNNTWMVIDEGYWLDANGNETVLEKWNSDVEHRAAATLVDYGYEYFEDITSWTSPIPKHYRGHFKFLWADTNGVVDSFSSDSSTFITSSVGYDPIAGGLVYFYNIPEVLDIPGEYYIGEDAVLYYYPTEVFSSAEITLPVVDDIVKLDDADYITFENLDITTCVGNAFKLDSADHVSILDCEIHAIGDCAVSGNGLYMTISGNYIYDVGDDAISITSGDKYVASDYSNETLIYNNYIRDWDRTTSVAYAIDVTGIGITVSHNTCHDSGSKGIHVGQGINVTIEYNHVYDILREVEDCGAISGDGLKENANIVVRYNYIHDVGSPELMELSKTKNPDILVMGAPGIYYDNMASYYTTYGNVIANIDGDGYVSNGGRHNVFTGNLIVNCSGNYVALNHFGFDSSLDESGRYIPNVYPRHTFYYSDAFKAENPEVAELIIEVNADTDPDDPMVFGTPAFVESRNNWVHYNTAYRAFTNWGVAPYKIDEYVWKFADEGAIDAYPGTHTTSPNMSNYGGRRAGYDLEQLIKETAAGVIEITWEQFEKIGVVLEDWNHSVEIPEKTTVFEKNHENK